MHKFSDREISDEHANKLNRAMLKREGTPLPEPVRDKYWQMKAACDRLGCHPGDELLVMVVMLCGELPDLPAPSFADMVANGSIGRGDVILVEYRKRKVESRFISLSGVDRALVLLEGEERAVPLKSCFAMELEAV